MVRSAFGVLVFCAAAGLAAPSQAEILKFTYFGTILEGEDISGVFTTPGAVQDDTDFADAVVLTPDAPTLVTTPFTPHGSGVGDFNLDEANDAGVFQDANASFSPFRNRRAGP